MKSEEQGKNKKSRQIESNINLVKDEVLSICDEPPSFEPFEVIACDKIEIDETEDSLSKKVTFTEPVNIQAETLIHKGVQANITISKKDKAVQTIVKKKRAKKTKSKCTETIYVSS